MRDLRALDDRVTTIDAELAPGVTTTLELRWQGAGGLLDVALAVPLPPTEPTMAGFTEALAALGPEAWRPGLVPGPRGLEYRLSIRLDAEGAGAARELEDVVSRCRAHLRRHFVRLCAAALAGPRREPTVPAPAKPAEAVSEAEEGRIRALLRVELPSWSRRLEMPLLVEEVRQPFFERHRILHVQSPSPMPALGVHVVVGRDGGPKLLSGRLETLGAVARIDRPAALDDPAVARAYLYMTGDWTRAAPHPDLIVESWSDIPWHRLLSPAETAEVARLHAAHATSLHRQRFEPTAHGWRHSAWLISGTQLVRRVTDLRWTGELDRQTQIIAANLPVPSGRYWAEVDGRQVPVG